MKTVIVKIPLLRRQPTRHKDHTRTVRSKVPQTLGLRLIIRNDVRIGERRLEHLYLAVDHGLERLVHTDMYRTGCGRLLGRLGAATAATAKQQANYYSC